MIVFDVYSFNLLDVILSFENLTDKKMDGRILVYLRGGDRIGYCLKTYRRVFVVYGERLFSKIRKYLVTLQGYDTVKQCSI